MTHLKRILAVAAALVGMTPVVHGVVYTDVDDNLAGSGYRRLDASGNNGATSYSGQFNILDHGYNPATMQVDSAVVAFAFADDGDRHEEWVSITLDSWTSSGIEVDGSYYSILTYDWVWGSIGGTILATLSNTGLLDFTITALRGDTYLKEAALVAHASSSRVSDNASTLALFGLGLLSMAVVRRRFRSR